jgi:predicted RNase H-related nuclease YkuK (DUF458 family)
MKNPFEKEDHTGVIVAAAIGAAAAGTLAWLFLTESGNDVIQSIRHKLKDEAKNIAADLISHKTGVRKRTVKKVADHIVK